MKVSGLLLAPGLGGFFYDDQEAIRRGAVRDGDRYVGEPLTPGFSAIRQPAATLGIGIALEDGSIAWGDAMSVQYAGAAGREPVFAPERAADMLRAHLADRLAGLELESFRAADAAVRALLRDSGLGQRALEYGFSQALLAAVALASRRTMAEVVAEDYGLPLVAEPVPIYAQSGDERLRNADRMILKGVDVLPHGLINNEDKFGRRGEAALAYVAWLCERIGELAGDGYRPTLHIDVYGLAGRAFDGDLERIVAYLGRVEAAAAPYPIRVESPVDFGSREAQINGMAELRLRLERAGQRLQVVADEWCNTLEDVEAFADAGAGHMLQVKVPDLGSLDNSVRAVLACRDRGMQAFLGGSCAETDVSARACVHVALATRPTFMLAKPGMGSDEGIMIVTNEQARLLAQLA